VEILFGTIETLRRQGVGIAYVSHKLDELFRVCDRVTVLRDGRRVHTGPLSELTPIRLIALMLGREAADVRERGVTGFGESHVAADGAPVLEAHGLERKHVLHSVSLAIRPGEVVGLGGLLGSGRSETAKALAGAQPLDGGEVQVEGRPVKRGRPAAAIRAGIAMIPEDRKVEGIIPHLSVRENIVLAALPQLSRAGLVSRRAQDELVATFMERLRIKAAGPEQPAGELSGGNQQKLLLARWLCLAPKVLILDEPTRGIDVGAKTEVQRLIDELARRGLGVLLISSELEEVLEGSDSVVVLRAGAVVEVLRGDDVTEPRLMAALAGGPEPGDG
jgi:monosaccharide-transporting ATPase